MELLKLYSALVRRKWILLQAIVFFIIAAGVMAVTLPKQYVSTSKVMVSTSDASMSVLADLGMEELVTGMSEGSSDIQNHIAMMSTKPILSEVIWRLQLRNDTGRLLPADKLLIPGMMAVFEAPPSISVKQHQSTDIILIEATSGDPELSRLLADTLASHYIADTQDRARGETREARAFVDDRLVFVRDEFDRALSDIADAQQRTEILDLDAEVRAGVSRLSELMLAAEENAARVQEINAQIREVESNQARERVDFVAPETVAENVDIRGYREAIATLRQERQAMLQDKTESHPDVVALDDQIAALQGDLSVALEEQHGFDPTLTRLQTERVGLLQRGSEINLSLARTTDSFADYPEKMQELSQLQLAATAAEDVYKQLQDQAYEIAIAEAMTVSPVQFVEPATRPERHLSPKMIPSLIMGMILGVVVGLGLVAVFEYVDDSIKSPEGLREVWDEPLLGVIQAYKAGVGITIANMSPTDVVVEGFRTLRSSIEYATLDKPAHMLAVTSAMPGEGKSTVLVNLAVSMAAAGKRVLIVDCDLRRPSQQVFWGKITNRTGVTSVMLEKVSISDAVQETGVDGLSVLTSGPIPPNPGTLVESLRLRQILLECAKSYDVVLVDAPPVLLVNDALLLGRIVDHMFVVVEAGKTHRRALSEARDIISGGGLQPVGIVLNKMNTQLGYYGGKYSKAYKAYNMPNSSVDAGTKEGAA